MFDTIGSLWRLWEGLFAGTNMPWGQSATAAFGMVCPPASFRFDAHSGSCAR